METGNRFLKVQGAQWQEFLDTPPQHTHTHPPPSFFRRVVDIAAAFLPNRTFSDFTLAALNSPG